MTPRLGLLNLLVLAVIGSGLVRGLIRRRSATENQSRPSYTCSEVVAGGLVLCFLAIVSGRLVLKEYQSQDQQTEHRQQTVELEKDSLRVEQHVNDDRRILKTLLAKYQDLESTEPEVISLKRQKTVSGLEAGELPDWIRAGNHVAGDVKTLVISSRQYASMSEAMADANQQAAQLLRKDLRPYGVPSRLSWRGAPFWMVHGRPEIKSSYEQTIVRDFGTFSAPMYRVWHQVELSPQVREHYLTAERKQGGKAHLQVAVAGFLAVLLIPVSIILGGYLGRAFGQPGLWKLAMACIVCGSWISGAQVLNRYVLLW